MQLSSPSSGKNKSIKCLNTCYAVLCAPRRKASQKSGETTRQRTKAKGFEVRSIAVGGPAPPLTGDPAGPVLTPSSIPQLFGESYYVPGSAQGPSNTQGNKLDKVSVADQIPHFRSPPGSQPPRRWTGYVAGSRENVPTCESPVSLLPLPQLLRRAGVPEGTATGCWCLPVLNARVTTGHAAWRGT